jgi:hypothetical protein
MSSIDQIFAVILPRYLARLGRGCWVYLGMMLLLPWSGDAAQAAEPCNLQLVRDEFSGWDTKAALDRSAIMLDSCSQLKGYDQIELLTIRIKIFDYLGDRDQAKTEFARIKAIDPQFSCHRYEDITLGLPSYICTSPTPPTVATLAVTEVPPHPDRTGAWLTMIGAILTTATASYFYLDMLLISDKTEPTLDDLDRYDRDKILGQVAGGTAVVLAGTALYLFLRDPTPLAVPQSKQAKSYYATMALGAGQGGIVAGLRW